MLTSTGKACPEVTLHLGERERRPPYAKGYGVARESGLRVKAFSRSPFSSPWSSSEKVCSL